MPNAVVLTKYGPPDVLVWSDVRMPQPGPGPGLHVRRRARFSELAMAEKISPTESSRFRST